MVKSLKIIFFLFLVFSFSLLFSQTNLVPNPGFESYTTCPSVQGNIVLATGWTSYLNTPDYYNICSTNNDSSIPTNVAGYQYPATGNGYAGLVIKGLSSSSEKREFIGCQLQSTLSVGQKYNISLKTTLCSLDSAMGYDCAANNIGVVFSTVPASSVTPYPTNKNFSHFKISSIVTDTLNWTLISGSFIADSSYKYLIIGNFFDDANTSLQCYFNTPYKFAYYYIDDVVVLADSFNLVKQIVEQEHFKIYPNPSTEFLNIENKEFQRVVVSIQNIFAEKVYESIINESKAVIDIKYMPVGIYNLFITTEKGVFTKKIIKN